MNIPIASRLAHTGEYYFSRKLRELAALNAAGANIISLGIGSPDLPPHPSVVAGPGGSRPRSPMPTATRATRARPPCAAQWPSSTSATTAWPWTRPPRCCRCWAPRRA